MKKKINVQFIIVSSFAVVFTAAAAMILFYNIFKNQVYDDIKDYTHIIQTLPQAFWENEKNIIFLAEKRQDVTKAGVNVQRNGSKKIRKFKGFEFPRLHRYSWRWTLWQHSK